MKITLNDKEYTLLIGYQNDSKHRTAFNDVVKKIFGFTIEEWYSAGYWNEKYIPYTLFDGERAVANVSVNIMDFNIFGEQQRYVQLGTGLTDEEYRNKNLFRFLMEKVLREWVVKCDCIYFYANKSAGPTTSGLYPKLGFSSVKEYEYFKSVEKNIAYGESEKLDMDLQSNRDKLYDYAKNSKTFGKLSMRENADLVMFYCISFLKGNIYYIKSLDIIVVAKFDDKKLFLLDVFGKAEVELDQIVYSLMTLEIDEVVLGFTPKDCSSYSVREIVGGDVLFIQNGKTMLFNRKKVMFPLLSHA